ncbi:MAG: uroporphyrinogen-III synthase [Syntrophobacterales bacterium]|nr:MAG: uroporphyrinogen-III synthase [Syntrophobacterales bacterium]
MEKPLLGRRIVITRAREQAGELSRLLKGYGAYVVELPTIKIVPPESWYPADKAIGNLEAYHWIIFTSRNGVKFFLRRLKLKKRRLKEFRSLRFCAIGPRTAQEIENAGVKVDLVPDQYCAEALVQRLGIEELEGRRILLARAKRARDLLPRELRKLGAVVDVIEVYQAIMPTISKSELERIFKGDRIDLITFTSSSTVNHFFQMYEERVGLKPPLAGVAIAAIGPITADTLRGYGITPDIMPQSFTIQALTKAIVDYVTGTTSG